MSSCSCGVFNCPECNPAELPEIPRGDLVDAMTKLAACNERLCRVALAADEVVAQIERSKRLPGYPPAHSDLELAIKAYLTVRNGQ